MKPVFRIVTDSAVPLWGLSSAERLRRQFVRLGVAQHEEGSPGDEAVILLDARYLYDQRVLSTLVETPGPRPDCFGWPRAASGSGR